MTTLDDILTAARPAAYHAGHCMATDAGPGLAEMPDAFDHGSPERAAFQRGWVDGRRAVADDHAAMVDARTAAPVVVDEIRAPHAGILRPLAMAHEVPASGPSAPDPFDGQRFTTVARRTRKGRTEHVVRGHRGRARVVGSWAWNDTAPDAGEAMSDARLALAQFVARTGADDAGRWDEAALTAAADAILGEHALPALIGGRVTSWHAIVRDESDSTDTRGVDVQHRCYVIDALPDGPGAPITYRTNGRLLARRTFGASVVDIDRAAAFTARLRDANTHDAVRAAASDRYPAARKRVTFPTRTRVRTPRARKGEDRTPLVIAGTWQTSRVLLWAPSTDRDRAFRGHESITRPTTARSARADRSARATLKRARRNVAVVSVTSSTALADALRTLAPGQAISWTWGDHVGRATRQADGRIALSGAVTLKGWRNVDAIARRVGAILAA